MRKIVLLSLILLAPSCKKKIFDGNDSPIVVSDTGSKGNKTGASRTLLVIDHPCHWKCDPIVNNSKTLAVVREWIPIGLHTHPFGDKYHATDVADSATSTDVTNATTWTLLLALDSGGSVEIKSIGGEKVIIECHGTTFSQS